MKKWKRSFVLLHLRKVKNIIFWKIWLFIDFDFLSCFADIFLLRIYFCFLKFESFRCYLGKYVGYITRQEISNCVFWLIWSLCLTYLMLWNNEKSVSESIFKRWYHWQTFNLGFELWNKRLLWLCWRFSIALKIRHWEFSLFGFRIGEGSKHYRFF